jgi:hypothetical protein
MQIALRQPSGAEDLLLCEAAAADIGLALALIGRLATPSADWSLLCVTDIEVLLLLLRRVALGDRIQAEAVCPARDCRARVDVSFRVEEYLSYYRPRVPKYVECTETDGWFRFLDGTAKFRVPMAADLVAATGAPEPEAELLRRCVKPVPVSPRLRNRVERAMQALAPTLSHEIEGTCLECQTVIAAYFDVQAFVLRELRQRAGTVYSDVHRLASRYKWQEESILAIPHSRRAQYAAMASDGTWD